MFEQLRKIESSTQAGLNSLATRVEELARIVSGVDRTLPRQAASDGDTDNYTDADRLVSNYELIAEGALPPNSDIIPEVLVNMSSPEPTVRISAARALATLSPNLAAERLPSLIKEEGNKFVASILKGVLRASLS